MKIAIVYDLVVRQDTTGIYVKKALEELGHEVTHFGIKEACGGEIPHIFDLYLQVDDDFYYEWSNAYHPSAYWVIDGHRIDAPSSRHPQFNVPFQRYWRLVKMESFDYTFIALQDKADMARHSQSLIDRGKIINYLPTGCDTSIHKPILVDNKYDWCFVGNVIEPKRQRFLDVLKETFPNCFIGRAYGDDMAKIFSESKIIFNKSLNNDINMRVFEGMACGGLLLTNATDNLYNLFGYDVATYECVDTPGISGSTIGVSDVDDCIKVMKFYLSNDAQRIELANRNLEMVRSEHTYKARVKQLLDVVFEDGKEKEVN